VLLVGVLVWGWFGYHSMPQRKDPDIPVRVAVAACSWPGATAQQVEQFITHPIEGAVAQNKTIHPGTAAGLWNPLSLNSRLRLRIRELAESVSDVSGNSATSNLKLNALNSQLPQGAGPSRSKVILETPLHFMLTIASPKG